MATSLALYYAEVARIPLLEDADVEFGLILRWRQNHDQHAKDTLIRSHLRFVIKEARKRATTPEQLQEYIAEGNIGLLEALKRYNVNRVPRMRFLTYAYFWIRERILSCHYKETIAHVPTHRQKAQRKLAKQCAAEHLRTGKVGKAAPPPEGTMVSLDVLFEQPSEADPSKTHRGADDAHMASRLRQEIARLPPREQTILNLYYGMKDEPRTDPQIAAFLGLSHERTRQIRVAAMGLLRRRLDEPANIRMEPQRAAL